MGSSRSDRHSEPLAGLGSLRPPPKKSGCRRTNVHRGRSSVTNSWTEGRVKELHREAMQDAERVAGGPRLGRAEPAQHMDPNQADAIQQQALQMLALAQRTAEDHIASAHSQADKIEADARVTAEQIVRDAQSQAD